MAIELPSDLDNLKNGRNLIDLEAHSAGDFGLDQFILTNLLDDIMLVEYVDEVEDIIETVKDKLHGSAAYLLTLGDVAKKIFEFVRDKREDYQEKKNDKTKKNKSTKSKIKNKK